VEYNEMGLPIFEIDPLGGRTIFKYDEVGRSSAVIDGANNRTEFMYDARGNLLRLTYPDDSKVSIEIDAYNKPASITDPIGAVWLQKWDEKGLLASQTSPLGSIITYQYDDNGLLTEITNAIGLTKRFNYDHDSNVTTITDSQGNRTHAIWNELGNIIQRTDALGHQTNYQYDNKNRLSAILLPNNSSIELTYDPNDNITCIKAEDGSKTQFDYFGFNYVKKRYESSGLTVEYHYNTEEQLTGITNQSNEFYELKRDALGRITEEIDYWGQTTKYQYDLSGNVTKKTDAAGREINFSLDKLGRILCKSSGNINKGDSFNEVFTYDKTGNIISCKNKHIIIERQFDLEGRITQEKQGDFVIKNSYDELGRRILLETSTGSSIQYNYCTSGQKENIQINGREVITFERDAHDRVIQQTMGYDLEQLFTYDVEGKLLFQGIKNDSNWLHRTEFEYDVTGNLIQRIDSVNGIDQFQYDTMGQLTKFIDSNGLIKELLHDPTGIKLETQICEQKELKVSNGKAEYSYWYREGLSNGTSYRFNRCGNLYERIDKSTNLGNKNKTLSHVFDWDVNQRLTLSQTNGNVTNYHYDPFGRRVLKKTSKCQTHFFWDGDTLIGERSYSSHTRSSEEDMLSTFREYVYYPDSFRPLALVDHEPTSSTVYFYYNDINGCPVRLLSTKGEVAWSAKYDTSGKANVSDSAIVTNPIRYQGQYFDEETELHYNRYRYYDPSIGQYISQDPIGLNSGSNLYRYAPNPLAWHDPLGLEPHYMEGWIERNGTEVPGTRTGVESGGMGKEAAGRYGLNAHTERKYIDAVEDQLQPGDVIRMRGSKNPCQPGCQPALRDVTNNKQVTAIYEASDTKTTWKYRQAYPGEFGKSKADVVLEKTRGGEVKRRRYYWSEKASRWKSKAC
jgi:RHS repeat-associated protein